MKRSVTIGDAEVPVVDGFVNGVATFVAGLLTTTVMLSILGRSPEAQFGRVFMAPAESFGWLYLGAHQVSVTVDGMAVNYAESAVAYSVAYYLVPVLLLLVAGYHVARSVESVDEPHLGVLAGATVVLGYLPLVALAAVVLPYEGTNVDVTVPFARSVLVAGIAYPVAVGGIGGALATLHDSADWS
ncbi:hypothetical protein [Halovivax gelatinilyticus]|uniref:hypothetical protein n=1 Tax=Halovivax gelatinilyticus TaxID=2961597 RepID=UPI0020CA2A0B|nr:hypothetical protein [Halovivax gelatinilyticus]